MELRYQPHLPLVLKGLTLSVAPGTRLGVCGRTGSGKSTLFLASFRMMETSRGVILVGGVDIQTAPILRIRTRPVQSLEHRLDEPVHEMGVNFSAGTVQLLCIAGVFLDQCHTVFLDEWTASVDYQSHAAVQTACREAFTGRTVIYIAHRIHTIIDYDLIACLDMGVLEEHGSPHELLLKDGGIFSGLVHSCGDDAANELRQRAAAASATRTTLSGDP